MNHINEMKKKKPLQTQEKKRRLKIAKEIRPTALGEAETNARSLGIKQWKR